MTETIPQFRSRQLRALTNECGVYALCDLDDVPIYVGQSFAEGGKDAGIRYRVRRHLTSARSDVIANRQLDVWEVAYVRGWPCPTRDLCNVIEARLFAEFDACKPLMNPKPLVMPASCPALPPEVRVQVLPSDEIARRKERRIRFPRQLQQVAFLLDYLLEVKDEVHVRRSLRAHFDRLRTYHDEFQDQAVAAVDQGSEND